MLVMDILNPYVKKLANHYIVRLALPAETLEFDLGFVTSGVTPAPAAIALRDALQVIGYNGPRVTSLLQMHMYKIVLDNDAIADSVAGVDLTDVTNSITTLNNSVSSLTSRATALEKQMFAQIEWSSTQPVFGGVQNFPTNSEFEFPWNRLVIHHQQLWMLPSKL